MTLFIDVVILVLIGAIPGVFFGFVLAEWWDS